MSRHGKGRVHGCHTPGYVNRFLPVGGLATCTLVAACLLRATGASAATFLPGSLEADPPTGATSPAGEVPAEQPASGIRWELAPLRYAGTVSLDTRFLRLDNGSRSRQTLVSNDIEFSTYVWQPWFAQLRAGIGILVANDLSSGDQTPASATRNNALTGRLSVSVFPASRFPFELRADVSDSRARGDSLGTDYRSHRVTVTQSYRPEFGNASYGLNVDYSRVIPSVGGDDTFASLSATTSQQFAAHSVDLSANLGRNLRSDNAASGQFANFSGRHTYHPEGALNVDTLASWTTTRLQGVGGDNLTGVRQVSTFTTWRPHEGDWLYSETSPLYLTGSARLVDTTNESGGTGLRQRAINASVGVSQELTPELRLAGSFSANLLTRAGGSSATSSNGNMSASYAPQSLLLGPWRYAPSLGAGIGIASSSESGGNQSVNGQFAHSLSRNLSLGSIGSIALNVSESLSVARDSRSVGLTRALAHSAGMAWQGSADDTTQSYVSLSGSDSRTWAQESGSFQLVNAQFSRRTQLSRHANWSGNLTLQATRVGSAPVDALTGVPLTTGSGWQRFFGGSLNYENQRVLGIASLRYSAQLTINSQQLESRAAGDIDATRERITKSLENRLDYSIGKLQVRLSARLAQVDGRRVTSVFVRLQRHY